MHNGALLDDATDFVYVLAVSIAALAADELRLQAAVDVVRGQEPAADVVRGQELVADEAHGQELVACVVHGQELAADEARGQELVVCVVHGLEPVAVECRPVVVDREQMAQRTFPRLRPLPVNNYIEMRHN